VGKNRDLVGLKLEAGIERIQVGLFRLTLGEMVRLPLPDIEVTACVD